MFVLPLEVVDFESALVVIVGLLTVLDGEQAGANVHECVELEAVGERLTHTRVDEQQILDRVQLAVEIGLARIAQNLAELDEALARFQLREEDLGAVELQRERDVWFAGFVLELSKSRIKIIFIFVKFFTFFF